MGEEDLVTYLDISVFYIKKGYLVKVRGSLSSDLLPDFDKRECANERVN